MAAMIQVAVPDAVVRALGANSSELSRRALEALVAECYRAGRITHAEAGEALGLDRWETDAFLRKAQAFRAGEAEEFAEDLKALRSIAK